MTNQDINILAGLKKDYKERCIHEKTLYEQYNYFIEEGCRKFNMDYENSFSAYSDAVLSVINNIRSENFDGRSSLKTYLYQIFSNKCIDLLRKTTTNKNSVHKSTLLPELLGQLPDKVKNAVQKFIDDQKIANLRKNLNMIGDKCREILLLFEDGVSDKEIAQMLSYNNAAVAKTTRLRCLEKLREKMSNEAE